MKISNIQIGFFNQIKMKQLFLLFTLISLTISNNAENHKFQDDIHYKTSAEEMILMLQGKQKLSFKRAVFLLENAYYAGKLNYNEYCTNIDNIKSRIATIKKRAPMLDENMKNNWAIFSYMTDSIEENNYKPFQYDYDNFMGDKDYESFMVTVLMKTHKGNCHSLPYMYKLLADETGAEAFLALAPMHLYIKHKDNTQKWWNLELTSGTYSRTSFIIESFNVSDAGIESGLYMKPLNEKESIALCLNDLLYYYSTQKNIYSGAFVERVYKEGLKVYPNSMLQVAKLECQKDILDKTMQLKELNNYNNIKSYPNIMKLYNEMDATNNFLQKIGYSKLTPHQYEEKVKLIENKKLLSNN